MNIALCFSGQFRSGDRAIESFLKKFFRDVRLQHTVDVFGHTWDTDTRTYLVGEPESADTDRLSLGAIDHQQFSRACGLLNICDWQIDSTDKFARQTRHLTAHPHILALNYSWRRSMELMAGYQQNTGRHYDLAVKLRWDLIYDGSVELGELVEWVAEQPRSCFWSNQVDSQGRINDIIYMGQPQDLLAVSRFVEQNLRDRMPWETVVSRALMRRRLEVRCLHQLIGQHWPVYNWYTILRPECRYDPLKDYGRCHEYWVAFYQSFGGGRLEDLRWLTLDDLRRDAEITQSLFGHVPPWIEALVDK